MVNIKQNKSARVAIYVRVSTLHQVDRDSLPMQKQDLLAYAKLMLGTDDCVIFEDAGYSGKNTDRPKYQEMMSQIRSGAFTHLLVWKIDRISRNLLDFAGMYKELKDLGVIFVSKNEQFDTSTAMGEAMLKIILVFAELERNMTSERVTATMIARANSGLWNGGRVPYGYSYDHETHEFSINENEAAVVTMIHEMYQRESSLVRVARELNERGYRSRSGNMWSPVSLQIILRNVFYCGDYRYNVLKSGDRQKVKDESEWVTVEDHHAGIVPRQQKMDIIKQLESNIKLRKQRNIYKSEKHIHVFGGLIFCGSCGKPLGSTPGNMTRDGWRYSQYICPTRRRSATLCTNKSASDPVIGELVFNYILNMMNAQKAIDKIHSTKDLERLLLTGDAFTYIDHIEPCGLNELLHILASAVFSSSAAIFKEADSSNQKHIGVESELSRLRAKRQRTERAMERLRSLYLYDDKSMSEAEYMIEKLKLEELLEGVDEQIGLLNADSWQQFLSDDEFIKRASEFIITQQLTDRKYISYKRLAMSVDSQILKDFVTGIIDSITVNNGLVSRVVFRNGLTQTFVFK